MKTHNRKECKSKISGGSALILTVVLTSLLAMVGVAFLMIARVDKIAASATLDNRDLNAAVDTVVAQISEELVADTPGVAAQEEYYDYPDEHNRWLASLEPYKFGNDYYWRQVSELTAYPSGYARDVQARVAREYDAITDVNTPIANADADGDGVGDAQWMLLDDITSSEGKPIYAAVRVIDNGAMLNANTAYKFDPSDPCSANIDGSSQLQIHLLALAGRPGAPPTSGDESALLWARANDDAGIARDLDAYERKVVWRYGEPNAPYTPFDISDELELRYRFLLNHTGIDTRLEMWGGEFRKLTSLSTPVTSGGREFDDWFARASAVAGMDPNYEYRHLATTYNMDRIICPSPLVLGDGTVRRQMVNINSDAVGPLFDAIQTALLKTDPNFPDVDRLAAQLAVNIIDYRDTDAEVTTFDAGAVTCFGFETPCVYISELAYNSVVVGDPPVTYRSYAVELHKPYEQDADPNAGEWELVIDGTAIPITWSGTKRFHVMRFEDPNAAPPQTPLLPINFSDPNVVNDYAGPIPQDAAYTPFAGGSVISLQRQAASGSFFTVDSVTVPGGWLSAGGGARSIERDITQHKCIRRLWATVAEAGSPTLGQPNYFVHTDPAKMQAHPANGPFTNVGELAMVFFENVYDGATVGGAMEADVRLDVANPAFASIFQYVTVFDPTRDAIDNDNDDIIDETRFDWTPEFKVPGRININTAPWFVLDQLPWVVTPIAKAITAYRDIMAVPGGPDYSGRPGDPGFESIADVMQVPEMYYFADNHQADLTGFPDLTPNDGLGQDFEERDVIFARISNLVTVRSDVFTAYILVRIDLDGPQKRMIAVLDRSSVDSADDNVRIVALQPVPDPR
jgi:hypothetical protein